MIVLAPGNLSSGKKSVDWSPGKTHTVRLCQRDIVVNVSYSSPAKTSNRQRKTEVESKVSRAEKENLNSCVKSRFKKKKELLHKNRKEKEFYKFDINQGHNLLNCYEQFQKNMVEKKTKKRLKVYSSSKTHNHEKTPQKYQPVPVKVINLNVPKPQATSKKNDCKSIVLTRRHQKTVSGVEGKGRQMVGSIRLYEKQNKSIWKEEATPIKSTRRKLQITSIRSRNVNDSMQSRRVQSSCSVLKGRHNTSCQAGGSIMVQSFNHSCNK